MKEKLVFFIDDDKIILDLLEYTFQNRNGLQVKTFATGEDALNHLNEKPDLVVLDYCFHKMGDKAMSGLETLKKIYNYNNEIPVIMLTSITDDEIIKDFQDSGAYKYICKDSYFIDTLMETIDQDFAS